MRKLSILLVIMFLVFAASFAFAGPMGWRMGHGYGISPYMASALNLTEEQSAKFQALRKTYLEEITPLQNQLFSKRAELRLLWAQASPDRKKIVAKQNEILELQKQLQEKITKYRLDCHAVLTPEQQSRLAAFGPGPWFGYGGPHWGRW